MSKTLRLAQRVYRYGAGVNRVRGFTMTFEYIGEASLVEHCPGGPEPAVTVGRVQVKAWRHQTYIRYPRTAMVRYESRKVGRGEPKQHSLWLKTDNARYVTIEVGDKVVYDSREDVPCEF